MCIFMLKLKNAEERFEPMNPSPLYTGLSDGAHRSIPKYLLELYELKIYFFFAYHFF